MLLFPLINLEGEVEKVDYKIKPMILKKEVIRVVEKLDDNWIYELKYDGYRCLAFLDFQNVKLISRNGLFFKYPGIIAQFQKMNSNTILDGEIICFNADGQLDFEMLKGRSGKAQFMAFDVLYHNGKELTTLP